MKKKLIFLICMLAVAIAVTACKSDKPSDTKQKKVSDSAGDSSTEVAGDALVDVNKVDITGDISEEELQSANDYLLSLTFSFMSNYDKNSPQKTDDYVLLTFAMFYEGQSLENYENKITLFQDNRIGVPVDLVNETLGKYFGVEIAAELPYSDETCDFAGIFTYSDDMFWMPQADIIHDGIPRIKSITDNGDGTFTIYADVYDEHTHDYGSVDYDEFYNTDINDTDKKYDYVYSIEVVVAEKQDDSEGTYEVIKYLKNGKEKIEHLIFKTLDKTVGDLRYGMEPCSFGVPDKYVWYDGPALQYESYNHIEILGVESDAYDDFENNIQDDDKVISIHTYLARLLRGYMLKDEYSLETLEELFGKSTEDYSAMDDVTTYGFEYEGYSIILKAYDEFVTYTSDGNPVFTVDTPVYICEEE